MPNFERLKIGEALPEGYRLATVADVVQHGHQLNGIRGGEWVDVQDFGDDYFDYYCRPLDFDKTRLKDGFIDNRRNLAWRKFGGLCVVDKLAISAPSSPDVELYSSSLPNVLSDDDPRVVALLYACVEEDVDEIKELVRRHGKEIILVNVHGVPCSGNALHLCAWEGKIKSLGYLLTAVDKDAAAKAVANLDGETPLLLAAIRGYVQQGIAVKLLLQFDKHQVNTASKVFGSTPLAMATAWSQNPTVCKYLLEVKEVQIDYRDQAGNTALHLAVQNIPLRAKTNADILELLLSHCGFETKSFEEPKLDSVDEDCIKRIGYSNQLVRRRRFKTMLGNKRRFVNIRNKLKETPLHHALAGISSLASSSHDQIILKLVSMLIWAGTKITKSDANRQTMLHHVCNINKISKVDVTIVHILEACFEDSLKWFDYARMQDLGGQTALHKAAFKGNRDVVSTILSFTRNGDNREEELKKKVIELVHERDFDGKMALHSAIMSKDANANDKMEIVKMLLEHAGDRERCFLLYANAENLGTAVELCQQDAYKCDEVRNYLQLRQKSMGFTEAQILQTTFKLRRHDIMVDLFNQNSAMQNIEFEGKEVISRYEEKYRTITSDQPSSLDLLNREDITSSIATLLLNQHTGSPISIGIFGGTGMGKSSLMVQVQCKMLVIAANQAIGNTQEGPRPTEEFKCFKTSSSSKQLCSDIIKLAREISPDLKNSLNKNENENVRTILSTYKQDFSPIFKRLAFRNEGNDYPGASRLRVRPALLTIEYNASQYEKQDEAWAGLAVEISREMVRSCMTAGQVLRISWIYAFKKNPQLFFINLLLPIVLTVFLGGFIGWAAWKLLSIPKSPLLKKFQYGSIPLSIFLVVWFVLKNILNEVKPVSESLCSDYKSLSTMHVEKLGLQNRVIEDITFLKKEIYKPTSFVWTGFAFLWKCVTYFFAEATSLELSDDLKSIPKNSTLRIVVFIDNLDRSKEELLTPLNTILSVCDINAVIAFDKQKIDKEHGEAILQQLIQLPIVLPDPSVRQIQNHFLKEQLFGIGPQEKTNLELDIFDDEDADAADDDEKKEEKKNAGDNVEDFKIATGWDAHYTRAEIEMFQHVAKHTYGQFRSPREWKSLLNYHRLIRSILSHSSRWKKVSLMKAWKRELILWLFLCWQWKKQMNGIIKNWSSLVKVPSQIQHVYKQNASRMLAQISARSSSPTQRWLDYTQERLHLFRQHGEQYQRKNQKIKCSQEDKFKAMDEIYPTLRAILKLRMEQLLEECQHPGHIREIGEECKMIFKKEEIVENLTQNFEIDESPQAKHRKRIRAWKSIEKLQRMIATLKKGQCDVSMSGILSFQEFRFHCKAGYLKLFVPESE